MDRAPDGRTPVKRAVAAITAGLAACVGVGVWVGREIDRAVRTIGR